MSIFVTFSKERYKKFPIEQNVGFFLRGRLNVKYKYFYWRGLALLQNPWTYGDNVLHTVYRYSCQYTHF